MLKQHGCAAREMSRGGSDHLCNVFSSSASPRHGSPAAGTDLSPLSPSCSHPTPPWTFSDPPISPIRKLNQQKSFLHDVTSAHLSFLKQPARGLCNASIGEQGGRRRQQVAAWETEYHHSITSCDGWETQGETEPPEGTAHAQWPQSILLSPQVAP